MAEVILPIYFVADQSKSMEGVIGEINSGLVNLLNAMQLEPMAASKIRFSVIGFADHPTCYIVPSDLRSIDYMPILRASGKTAYAAVFRFLRESIHRDVTSLRNQGFLITRPSVFFLTDGQPTDPEALWRSALADLKNPNFGARPNILAFGIGEIVKKPEILIELATNEDFAMVSAHGADIGESLARFAESLTHSIVASGQAISQGSTELPVMKPDGFVLAVDILA
jgi:uncharacterized protein YegL